MTVEERKISMCWACRGYNFFNDNNKDCSGDELDVFEVEGFITLSFTHSAISMVLKKEDDDQNKLRSFVWLNSMTHVARYFAPIRMVFSLALKWIYFMIRSQLKDVINEGVLHSTGFRAQMHLSVKELLKDLLIGCRADASEAAIILLPSNITVFALDFSGSGLSGGEHVTLGWNEVRPAKFIEELDDYPTVKFNDADKVEETSCPVDENKNGADYTTIQHA